MSGVRKKAYALKVYWKEKLKKSKKNDDPINENKFLSSTQYGSCWTYTIEPCKNYRGKQTVNEQLSFETLSSG